MKPDKKGLRQTAREQDRAALPAVPPAGSPPAPALVRKLAMHLISISGTTNPEFMRWHTWAAYCEVTGHNPDDPSPVGYSTTSALAFLGALYVSLMPPPD